MVQPAHTTHNPETGSYEYPAGHLGYLPPEHQEALAKLKSLAVAQNLYIARSEGARASHNDVDLL